MQHKKGGIDIGKKNLGLCIITKTNENKLIEINEWVNINLVEENMHKCDGTLKNKQKCTASAKFYHMTNDITKYYCATHKKQHIVNDNSGITKYDNKTKQTCEHVTGKCTKNSNFMVGGKTYCKVHADLHSKKIVKNNSLQIMKKTRCSDIEPQVICARIFENLNKYEILRTIVEMRIENQPSYINPEMKAVASMVLAYFVSLNVMYNLNINIIYVSPGSKTKYSELFINFMINKITQHKTNKKANCKCEICKLEIEIENNKVKHELNYEKYYFDHEHVKLVGVYYTEYILIENNLGHLFDMISKYKKKDDVCDAFLHAFK
jgi:hypothetical protein